MVAVIVPLPAILLALAAHRPAVSPGRCALAALVYGADPEVWTTVEEGAIRRACEAAGMWPRRLGAQDPMPGPRVLQPWRRAP
jgi:hypothetical protein